MKPLTVDAVDMVKSCKIHVKLSHDPKKITHAEAEDTVARDLKRHLDVRELIKSNRKDGRAEKTLEVWVFNRKQLRELIEHIQGEIPGTSRIANMCDFLAEERA